MEEQSNENVSFRKKAFGFLLRYYLPISYLVFVIFGYLVPAPGAAIDHIATKYVCIILIFLNSGLYLRTQEMKDVLQSVKGAIFGLVSILAITPLIGGQLTSLLNFDETKIDQSNTTTVNNMYSINATKSTDIFYNQSVLGPLEYKYGLVLFFIMPCTISSGVVMITQMNGNVALGLFLTVVANIIGIFTVPLLLKLFVLSSLAVQLDITSLIWKLFVTLFLPLLVGKLLRFINKVRNFVQPRKPISKILSTTLLDILIWTKISTTSQAGLLSTLTFINAIFLLGWALLVHIIFLIVNAACCLILQLPYEQKKSVILLASQKTLAVAIPVASFLPSAMGSKGVMMIAMILSHFIMLVFDAILVAVWQNMDLKKSREVDIQMEEMEGMVTS